MDEWRINMQWSPTMEYGDPFNSTKWLHLVPISRCIAYEPRAQQFSALSVLRLKVVKCRRVHCTRWIRNISNLCVGTWVWARRRKEPNVQNGVRMVDVNVGKRRDADITEAKEDENYKHGRGCRLWSECGKVTENVARQPRNAEKNIEKSVKSVVADENDAQTLFKQFSWRTRRWTKTSMNVDYF